MYQTLEYSLQDGIAVVRLNRQAKLNAIDAVMAREFGELVAAVRADRKVRVLVFTGNGRAFCAGADIANLNSFSSSGDFMSFIEALQVTFNALEDLDRPTIAAVNGLALGGGCELALTCDFRIMAEGASIGVPEILIGVLPGGRDAALVENAAAGDRQADDLFRRAVEERAGGGLRAGQRSRASGSGARRCDGMGAAADQATTAGDPSGEDAGACGNQRDQKTGVEAERLAMAFLFGTEDRIRRDGRIFGEAKRGV